MIFKILKKDVQRKKVITAAVFIFIMLSALLMASGSNMLIDLNNSLDFLFEKALVPHFLQSHSGDIKQGQIDKWSAGNPYVKQQQTIEMLNIDNSKIYINSKQAENNSFMENGFVKQNKDFDYLLNLHNEIIKVNEGEIAVPIHYMQTRKLSIGDKIVIKNNDMVFTFTISSFVRDVLMNPSLISSKRFVVSNTDFEKLKAVTGEIEYLISFRLNNPTDLQAFSNQYSLSDLPQKGPIVDYQLLTLFNSLTDGLIAAAIILISLLLNVIALLCLRFIILITIEEDYKEIGVMKAIGILPADIRRIYLSRYIILALTAAVSGYLLSLSIYHIFSKNIMLYIGIAPKSIIESGLPLLAALLIAVIVIIFSLIILRKLNGISAVEAIRMGSTAGVYLNNEKLALYKNKVFNTNVFLGIRDVVIRFKLYLLLLIVFILVTFIIIVPLNFLNTILSPEMIKYTGIGKCDILMDIRQSDQTLTQFEKINKYLKNDPEVKEYAAFVTCKFKVIDQEGLLESIYLQTGDFTVFPLDYLQGAAPILPNEIALSYLSSTELEKKVGDEIEVIIDEKPRSMIVTGIYQDLTNGGRSAKANILPDHETASWYTFSVNVNSDVASKAEEYEQIFDDVKVTDTEGYRQETFVVTMKQLELLINTAIFTALLVTILITSLFMKMLIAKDRSQIAIMQSIGIAARDIKKQYLTKALLVLNTGIVIGIIAANSLGQWVFSIVLAMVGASSFKFVINPLEAYVLSPVIIMLLVTLTTLVSSKSINQYSIAEINVE